MERSLFSPGVRVEIVICLMLVSALIVSVTWCGCAGGVKEGFAASTTLMGAALDYCMNAGVPVTKGVTDYIPPEGVFGGGNAFANLEGNTGGPVPLPPDQLFMFQDNKFSGDCCPSTYTNSMGCACLSEKQAKYLNERAGNRSAGIF